MGSVEETGLGLANVVFERDEVGAGSVGLGAVADGEGVGGDLEVSVAERVVAGEGVVSKARAGAAARVARRRQARGRMVMPGE